MSVNARKKQNEEKIKYIIYNKDSGFFNWVIQVALGFKNLDPHKTRDIYLLDFLT